MQIPSYQADLARFEELNTQVLGISVDSIPSHESWIKTLGGVTYPLCSDFWPHGQVAKDYGVLTSEGHSERALFIIDKEGIIRFIDVHPIEKQPSNQELFDILQTIK